MNVWMDDWFVIDYKWFTNDDNYMKCTMLQKITKPTKRKFFFLEVSFSDIEHGSEKL